MSRRAVSSVIIAMLLAGILTVAFSVQPVKSDYAWTETIYIRADGSIQPSMAPISSVDNVTYTLTDNIAGNVTANSSAITVQRDNSIIDGAGHTLQGTRVEYSYGTELTGSNVTIKNMRITAFWDGIWFHSSSNNSVSGNNITSNDGPGIAFYDYSSNNSVSGNSITANDGPGIWLNYSSNNSLSGNKITANIASGIYLNSSSNNSLSGNNIANNYAGIWLDYSSNNSLSGNNITNNGYGIYLVSSSNSSIAGNNITGNSFSGLGFSFSSNNSIVGNSFFDDGLFVGDSYGNVVTDNLVNGRPLVYLEDVSGYAVGDAGQVILVNCNNVTVENLNLSNCNTGVELWETNNTSISGNNITANIGYGILLYSSSNNSVSGNNVTNKNWAGVYLLSSSNNNSVSGNNITNNLAGIGIEGSNNTIYLNNIMNNTNQVYFFNSTSVWDDGYPSGGNYWSDYNGTDSNGDGIGDTPHIVDANNIDRYPLMAPYGMFYAGTWNGTACSVGVMSNSTVSGFKVDVAQKTVSFNVTGAEGSIGFCRVTIPNIIVQNLWQGNYTVLVDGEPWPFSNWTDATNTYVYFNYTHSQHQTVIIPEFPSLLILPMLMIMTLLAIIISRRKWPKRQTGSRQHLERA